MTLDPLLQEVLVCPEDRGSLWYFEDEQVLYNPRLRRKYLIRDGIPVMLIDEAVPVDLDDHRRYSEAAAAGGVPETGVGRDASTGRPPQTGPSSPVRGTDAANEAKLLADRGGKPDVSGPDDPPSRD